MAINWPAGDAALELFSSRVLCPAAWTHVLPGVGPCVPCRAWWLVILRILLLSVDVATPVVLAMLILKPHHSSRYLGAWPLLGLEVVVVWGIFSHPYWLDRATVFNFVTVLYLIPGSWLTPDCLVGDAYESRVSVHILELMESWLTLAILTALLGIASRYLASSQDSEPPPFNALIDKLTKLRKTNGPIADLMTLQTKTGLRAYIERLFGADSPEALAALTELEASLKQSRRRERQQMLLGFIQRKGSRGAALRPIYLMFYLLRAPKAILSFIIVNSCRSTHARMIGRQIYSRECGISNSSHVLQTCLMLLAAASLGAAALGLLYIVRFNAHSSMRSHQVESLLRAPYHSKTSRYFYLARFHVRAILIPALLASNRFLISLRITVLAEVVILCVSLMINPHGPGGFHTFRAVDISTSLLTITMLLFFERLQYDAHVDVLAVRDPRVSPHADGLVVLGFTVAWAVQTALIFGSASVVYAYEHGKNATYKYYHWRSAHPKDLAVMPAGLRGHLLRCCQAFYLWCSTKFDLCISYDAENLITRVSRFTSADRPAMAQPPPNVSAFLRNLESGLCVFAWSAGPYVYRTIFVGLLTRFCLAHVEDVRSDFAPVTTSERVAKILAHLPRADSESKLNFFDEWLSSANHSEHNHLIASEEFYHVLADALRHERTWLRDLISMRQIMRLASSVFDPATFDYIEALNSEYALAVDHLYTVCERHGPLLLITLARAYDEVIGHGESITLLEARKTDDLNKLAERTSQRYTTAQLEAYVAQRSQLDDLQRKVQDAYIGCVRTQVAVLETLIREGEQKLTQAGYSQAVAKELSTMQNARLEVERSQKPVDVLALHVETSSDVGEASESAGESLEVYTETVVVASSSDESEKRKGLVREASNSARYVLAPTRGSAASASPKGRDLYGKDDFTVWGGDSPSLRRTPK